MPEYTLPEYPPRPKPVLPILYFNQVLEEYRLLNKEEIDRFFNQIKTYGSRNQTTEENSKGI